MKKEAELIVITGGPGCGKTSVINVLKKKYHIFPESARIVLTRNKLFKNKNAVQARGLALQAAIWKLEFQHYKKAKHISTIKPIFFDRGFFDSFAYAKLSNLNGIDFAYDLAKSVKYDKIFVLKMLPKRYYANDKKRAEDYKSAIKIEKEIISTYKRFGYKPIIVPFDTIENRTNFILKRL